jgi:23S rRNA (uridine2552-2'-O)-methyltransferase
VFKLEEIDRREHLLKPGQTCLDLGAAPGAWSQYARARVGRNGRIVATDILAMPDVAGVEFVQGDIREPEVLDELLRLLPGRQVDLVLSDMAPNLSGVDVIDQPRSAYLAELALDMSARILKPGGGALIKVFQGAGFRELVQSARGRFARIRVVKPVASRSRSPEIYLLAMQFRLV